MLYNSIYMVYTCTTLDTEASRPDSVPAPVSHQLVLCFHSFATEVHWWGTQKVKFHQWWQRKKSNIQNIGVGLCLATILSTGPQNVYAVVLGAVFDPKHMGHIVSPAIPPTFHCKILVFTEHPDLVFPSCPFFVEARWKRKEKLEKV